VDTHQSVAKKGEKKMPTMMDEYVCDEMDYEREVEQRKKEQLKLSEERFDKTIVSREDQLEFQKKIDEGFFEPKIKVKKLHPDAVLPQNAHEGDAGYDLAAIDDGKMDDEGRYIEYDTGLAIQPPQGFHTCIYPRSSISKYDLSLANSVGIVDGGYRNSLKLRFFRCVGLDYPEKIYKKGDKIGQLVIVKTENMPFEWADELDETERGHGGFGSTGV